MPKPLYVVSSPDVPNPLKGKDGKGDNALVYDDADLARRKAAAAQAGITVIVTPYAEAAD